MASSLFVLLANMILYWMNDISCKMLCSLCLQEMTICISPKQHVKILSKIPSGLRFIKQSLICIIFITGMWTVHYSRHNCSIFSGGKCEVSTILMIQLFWCGSHPGCFSVFPRLSVFKTSLRQSVYVWQYFKMSRSGFVLSVWCDVINGDSTRHKQAVRTEG